MMIKKIFLFGTRLLCLSLIFFFSSVVAQEQSRLFISSEDREVIHTERMKYLDVMPSRTLPLQRVQVKPQLPHKISISSIIITPDNRKIIRVNNAYQRIDMRRITTEYKRTTLSEVVYKIGQRFVIIPVGKTFFPQSNKLVKNHKVDQKKGF